MKNIKPEILSPVGSNDSLIAAVRSGADAVYIGAKDFSARRNAQNFDKETLKSAVDYCHVRGVKVYLALNIMLKQSELKQAFETALYAVECGIDAIILQDLGLAALIHKHLPNVQLHASTQMSVHSPSALDVLKKMSFSRVVVAREMSEKALREFCIKARENDIEVEVFVHGALCMSVSGQCLLSSVLGARSGNRGLCAGPCRLPFSVARGTGYDLSLKDLSLCEHINKLKEMGVSSLKIEGRMKRPEYVAAATAVCRSAVDCGIMPVELTETLRKVFSRTGFTDGYFTEKTGIEMFGIRTKEDVTASKETFSEIHKIYRCERQTVPLEMDCEIISQKPITLSVFDGKHKITVTGEVSQSAKSKPIDADFVKENLQKLGNTPYFLKKSNIKIDDELYVPASAINSLRRDAIEKLNIKRSEFSEKISTQLQLSLDDIPHQNRSTIVRFSDVDQIPENLNGINAIILPTECDFSKLSDKANILIADIPRYINNEDLLLNRLKQIKSMGVKAAYCSNIAAISIAREAGLAVIGGIGLNVMNSENINILKELNVSAVTLSAEITLSDAVRLNSPLPKGIFAYGRLPLMLTKNCPVKNGKECVECDKRGVLVDRKNKHFPVMCRKGYSELLNSEPIYLADRLGEITNIDFVLLYFTTENTSECEQIIEDYLQGGKPKGEFTRGLYYRNLL